MTNTNRIIAIATYKRPSQLAMLLNSIREDPSASDTQIIVIDNDPDCSARATVSSFDDMLVMYLCEPRPGISAARNCALEYAIEHGYNDLAFVDDDEQVASYWFGALLQARASWPSSIVCGPVYPIIPGDAPKWVKAGRFFDRPNGPTGSDVRWPATNNVLISLELPAIRRGLRFSEDFSLTGGEDTDFFYKLKQQGAKIIWSKEAAVMETVPLTRANFKWIWRRGNRLGNVSTRILARRYPSIVIVSIAVARIALSLPLALLAKLSGNAWGPAAMHLPKGVGMLQAVAGNLTEEYKR